MKGYSVKHTILVGNYYFNPSTLNNVSPGDTIRWQWVQGSHTTTSSSIPSGAASWDELINSGNQVYEYTALVSGTYNYVCTPHAGMGQVGSFTVNAAAPLTVNATADPSKVCLGQSAVLQAQASGGTGTYTYSWVSNPPGFTSNQATVQVTPSQTTMYTVTVTSGTQTASDGVNVTVQAPPAANAGTDTVYCDNVISFPVTGSASNQASVTWSTTGDGSFANGSTLSDIYSPGSADLTNGFVDLILTANPLTPCTGPAVDTLHIIFDECTGILVPDKSGISMKVFPNPSNGQFRLTTGPLAASATLQVFDIRGRIVHEGQIGETATGISLQLSLDGLPSGLYQVRIVSGDMTGTARLIIR